MAININITPRFHEPFDKTLRRFSKKYKKEQIAKELSDRAFFLTKTQKRRMKRLARQKKLEKKRLKQQKNAFE